MNNLSQIIIQYKVDTESVYNTWFVDNDQRLKEFRTIRRGVLQVIEDIKNKTFPNDFKGSSLEFVLSCIAEIKQKCLKELNRVLKPKGKFELHTIFNKPKVYRGWIQFQGKDKVYTNDFVMNVAEDKAGNMKDIKH